MTIDHHRRRRALLALAGLLLGLFGALVGPAAPASAHAVLQRSDPLPESIVPEAPSQVTLTFTEPVRLVPGRTVVLAPDGSRADQGEPTLSGATVTVNLRAAGDNGTYLVSYRVISADSHPVAGGFTYSVGSPSTPPTATDDLGSEVDPAVRLAIPVAKYLGYAGLLLLIGPVMVLALLWPHRLSRRGPARLAWTGMGLVVASTLAGLWLQVPYTTGGGIGDVRPADIVDVLATTYGTVMLVRLGVLCAAAVLLRPLLSGTGGDSRTDLALLAVLGVSALATWPLTGHPSASPVAGVSVVADAVHLAAMAVWLGGLVMLVGFLLPRADERELGAILPIWSRWAALAVGSLALAGVTQALIEVGTFAALFGTSYGRLIIAKLALFALVIAAAAYSRRLVRRGAEQGPGRLRRVITVELAITAVVLGVTAALVQITPARTAIATSATAGGNGVTSSMLRSELYTLRVDFFPAQVGNNSLHLYAYTPDNAPLPVAEWKATAALPARNVEPIEIRLLPITDNHAVGEINLPAPGQWQLRFTVRISEIDQATVSKTVNVT